MADRDRQFADAMNDLRSANLLDRERSLIEGFVEEYFASPSPNRKSHGRDFEDDSSSESDDMSDEDRDPDSLPVEISSNEESDPEEEQFDQPLITIGNVGQPDEEDDGGANDDDHRRKASGFRCRCKLNDGGPCSTRYSVEDFVNSRYEMSELTKGRPT